MARCKLKKVLLARKYTLRGRKPTHGDKIRFAPPLLITEEQIDEAVGMIGGALGKLEG